MVKLLAGMIAATVLMTGAAHARIGETTAELETRYGKGIEAPGKASERTYLFKTYKVNVTLLDGKSIAERISKIKEDADFPLYEAEKILSVYGTGWVTDTKQEVFTSKLPDKKLDATFDGAELAIISDTYVDWKKKSDDAIATEKTKGF